MTAHDDLREQIDRQERRLRRDVPADREAATLALLRGLAALSSSTMTSPDPDLITGRHVAGLGANKALQLCLESSASEGSSRSTGEFADWAERFLQACEHLVEAEQVLVHCETGFMRLVAQEDGTFAAWIATKRPPTIWRERADIAWWASSLARQHASELLQMMAYQLNYPPEAILGGCSVQTHCDVLGWLLRCTVRDRDGGAVSSWSEQSLTRTIADDLRLDAEIIARVVASLTVERASAAYHAAVPGVAAAPLVRLNADRLIVSPFGVTTQPFFFLTRDLRRRDAEAYHNSAFLREQVFRKDLYALFADKRFVTSPGRIKLRRTDGDVRTDIDAVVFDRKTGTLGLFELKSQDPFARSTAELTRQRDNVLYANRQISGILAWVQRYGADELLDRVDHRTAKTFRAHKIFPFVLGRYLVHFTDGPTPDRRAAWATWPQLLRLLDGHEVSAKESNPLASLFTRLSNDVPLSQPIAENSLPAYEIPLGDR
ncbi:MAG TPA: hypothetical protein VFL82_08205, partial [Thermomicrobiales bacterium]|nr:hypothetical protein [Thermomicrobiales bacterium]